MHTKEGRRAPRTKHDSVVEIYDDGGHLIIGIGRLVNYSNVGICFTSSKALKLGQRVHARVRLLKEGALEISSRVVWQKKRSAGYQYGIEFDSIQKIRPVIV